MLASAEQASHGRARDQGGAPQPLGPSSSPRPSSSEACTHNPHLSDPSFTFRSSRQECSPCLWTWTSATWDLNQRFPGSYVNWSAGTKHRTYFPFNLISINVLYWVFYTVSKVKVKHLDYFNSVSKCELS